ncbi:glutathione S-transferase family protein, partial [Roseibium sp.]|uniref:glutathione S-transferase family protein n=2 Tax=Roseibium sp. TaxID=1936156 RepID=UPI003D14D6E9
TMADQVELFYAPQTRATGVRVLLEELDAPYKLNVLNFKLGENRQPDYLSVNPSGKVPALRHRNTVITEQVAIYMYLADLFSEKGLAPALDDPLRGPYLRWFVHMASCYEPALIDKALNREEPPHSMSAYGSFDTVMENMRSQLAKGPYVLGERFTAVDVLWAMGLGWGMRFGIVPELDEFKAYTERFFERPSAVKVLQDDQNMAKEQEDAAIQAGIA